MSRKKKREERAEGAKKREVKEENFSPFASVVLKEAKPAEPKKPAPLKPRKPSEVVKGYDPNASFADILSNWERTGDPYAMPKKGSAQVSKLSFGDILDQWEGKSSKPKTPVKGEVKRVSPEYKATRSFADILDQYEGKGAQKPQQQSNEVNKKAEKTEVKAQRNEEVKVTATSFFREKEEDDERPASVAWSIYGDNHPIKRPEVRKEPEVSTAPEPRKEEYSRKSERYVPTKDFGTILAEYSNTPVKPKETPKSEPVAEVKPEAKPVTPSTPSFFREKEEDDERPASVAWSIYGDNHPIKRPEVKKEAPPVPEKSEEVKPVTHAEVRRSELFTKEVGRLEVKSFEDILKEKGEENEKKKGLTLHQVRMMLPQVTLDLHGMTQEETTKAVNDFLLEGYSNGLDKVSIIHGKGLHSEDGPGVLKELTELLCRDSEYVREYTNPKAQYGGSGALWVILKKKADA